MLDCLSIDNLYLSDVLQDRLLIANINLLIAALQTKYLCSKFIVN